MSKNKTATAEVLPINPEAETELMNPEDKNLPAPQSYSPGGLEDIDDDDIIIPRIRIVQPTSEEGTPGTYRLNLTGDEYQDFEAFFIKISKGRVLFSKDLKEGAICGSVDRITPDPFFEHPMADFCEECSYSKWVDRKTPGQCGESYTLLGMMIESMVPFIFQTRSTGIRPTKSFISAAKFNAKKRRANLWDFSVTMKLKEVKGEKGKFYVPIFDRLTYLKDRPYGEEAELYRHEKVGFEDKPPKGDNTDADGTGVPNGNGNIPF